MYCKGFGSALKYGPEGAVCRVLKTWQPQRVADLFLMQSNAFWLYPYESVSGTPPSLPHFPIERCDVFVQHLTDNEHTVVCHPVVRSQGTVDAESYTGSVAYV